jgi:glycosyltransferase involved in cell wall biosynthesis
MPVYNRERFVEEAIRSVVDQDLSDFELLVVDDGSTDRTPEILREWAQRDGRIVVITSPQNEGIPNALNRGLRSARAPYVARLDSDDVMMPRRLAAQSAVLDEQAEIALVSCAYDLMDVDGKHLARWLGDEPHEVVSYFLNFYNIVGGGGQVMFRRSDVLELGGYAAEYPSSEDYDLWVRLLRRGRFLSLPLVGMKQRQHNARSDVQYGARKRHNWTSIMSESLARHLGRAVATTEINALITLWRLDGALGMAPTADAILREAFSHFCHEHEDAALRNHVRRRTAQQWMNAATTFLRRGQRIEALRYVLRAARWNLATVFATIA